MSEYKMSAEFRAQLVSFYTHFSLLLYGMDLSEAPFEACFEGAFRAFSGRLKEADVFLEDQLNLAHRSWEVFDSPGEFMHESMLELYDQAVSRAIHLIRAFFEDVVHDRRFEEGIRRNHSYWKFEYPEWFREMYHF